MEVKVEKTNGKEMGVRSCGSESTSGVEYLERKGANKGEGVGEGEIERGLSNLWHITIWMKLENIRLSQKASL